MASIVFSIVHSYFTRPEHSVNTPMTFIWHQRQLWFPSHLLRSLWKCHGYSSSSIDVNVSLKKVRPKHSDTQIHLYIYLSIYAPQFVVWQANWTKSIFNEVKNRFLSKLVLEYPTSRTIYDETNQRIENWTKIIYFFIMKVTPVCWIFPKFAISIFMYFTTDMGRDALKLPIPMW